MRPPALVIVALAVVARQGLGQALLLPANFLAQAGPPTAPNLCPSWVGYDFQSVYNSGLCLPCNAFDPNCFQVPLPDVPFPHSNHNYALDNPLFAPGGLSPSDPALVSPSGRPFPHVAVTTFVSTTTTTANAFSVLSGEVDYDWADFYATKTDAVWTQLNGGALAPGVYNVQLNAWDAYHSSGVCQLCFSISDYMRPQSTTTCPNPKAVAAPATGWTSAAATAVASYLASVEGFATSRTNNDCTTVLDAASPLVTTCNDVTTLVGTDWFNCSFGSALGGANKLRPTTVLTADFTGSCVRTGLTTNPFASATTLAAPASTLTPAQCTRRAAFNYTWYEPWVAFGCDAAPVGYCSNGLDALGGDPSGYASANKYTCANAVAVSATTADLVATATLAPNTTSLNANPLFIANPAKTFPNQNSGPSTLHFWTPEDASGAPLPVSLRIRDLVMPAATAKAIAGLTLPPAAQLVFWRWQSSSLPGQWLDYSANDVVVLDGISAASLTFEAWTACGPVANAASTTWSIVLHPKPSLRGWFHANWVYAPNTAAPHCNVEGSDFGSVYFHLNDADVAPIVGANWHIQSLTCTWSYGGANSTKFKPSTASWTPTITTSDTYFAVKMVENDVTRVGVTCAITLRNSTNNATKQETHTHAFWFEDCDAPLWQHRSFADESCVTGCVANSWKTMASRVAAPFQACAGNLIYPAGQWDAPAPVQTILDLKATKACCGACNQGGFANGKTAVCKATAAVSAISRCEPANFTGAGIIRVQPIQPASTALSLVDMLMPTDNAPLMAMGVVVGLVAAAVVAVHRRGAPSDVFENAYTPLMD
ncbi:Aste57867_3218 [Aphanomyces stellatus]|uniref:Aste57867_3218 protein n=1 Tax=Aphanomyces stellatus TaxID=120398 RepID=A0A485K9X6_9STRA|nr:hypothetical protein As57867_003208 [Aphanomyces stellatus]VFT80392.1 Aste57867_3218 [Aphanomyces stellatus]